MNDVELRSGAAVFSERAPSCAYYYLMIPAACTRAHARSCGWCCHGLRSAVRTAMHAYARASWRRSQHEEGNERLFVGSSL